MNAFNLLAAAASAAEKYLADLKAQGVNLNEHETMLLRTAYKMGYIDSRAGTS